MSTTAVNAPDLAPARKKFTTRQFQSKKERGERITMLTAYDYPTALLMDQSGIDTILVGDSLGMVVLGYENTLPVTMEEMLHHSKAVARGAHFALKIGDMPFMSYQVSPQEAVRNAGRFLQEGGMDAVKLEGGRERLDCVQLIVAAGIPVMGHIGLTPQSIHQLGGFRAQGKTANAAQRLLEDALALQDAGCFGLVLESVPARLAALLTARLEIPTIGIGAGAGCDGQVLVSHDVLGWFERGSPRFSRQYANLHQLVGGVFAQYIQDVETGAFPAEEHQTDMPEAEWAELIKRIG